MNIRIVALISALALAACETPPSDGSGGNGSGPFGSGGVGAGGVVAGTQSDLEQNVGDRVFFGTDSSVLSAASQQTLQRQAEWLNEYPDVKVVLEGHCDERGTREYNLALGERRASAARNHLVSLGVSPSRMRVVSYGKERPAVLGSGDSAWSQNRRAVTVISY